MSSKQTHPQKKCGLCTPNLLPYDITQPKQQFLLTYYPCLIFLLEHSCQMAVYFFWKKFSDKNSSTFEAAKLLLLLLFLSILSAVVVKVVSFVIEDINSNDLQTLTVDALTSKSPIGLSLCDCSLRVCHC